MMELPGLDEATFRALQREYFDLLRTMSRNPVHRSRRTELIGIIVNERERRRLRALMKAVATITDHPGEQRRLFNAAAAAVNLRLGFAA